MNKLTPYEAMELVAEKVISEEYGNDWWFGDSLDEFELWVYDDGNKDGEDTVQRFLVDFSVSEIKKEHWR